MDKAKELLKTKRGDSRLLPRSKILDALLLTQYLRYYR